MDVFRTFRGPTWIVFCSCYILAIHGRAEWVGGVGIRAMTLFHFVCKIGVSCDWFSFWGGGLFKWRCRYSTCRLRRVNWCRVGSNYRWGRWIICCGSSGSIACRYAAGRPTTSRCAGCRNIAGRFSFASRYATRRSTTVRQVISRYIAGLEESATGKNASFSRIYFWDRHRASYCEWFPAV